MPASACGGPPDGVFGNGKWRGATEDGGWDGAAGGRSGGARRTGEKGGQIIGKGIREGNEAGGLLVPELEREALQRGAPADHGEAETIPQAQVALAKSIGGNPRIEVVEVVIGDVGGREIEPPAEVERGGAVKRGLADVVAGGRSQRVPSKLCWR
jgi:hypothetical protein